MLFRSEESSAITGRVVVQVGLDLLPINKGGGFKTGHSSRLYQEREKEIKRKRKQEKKKEEKEGRSQERRDHHRAINVVTGGFQVGLLL